MTDDLKRNPETLPTSSTADEVIETARIAWGAAMAQCAAAHRATLAHLDHSTDLPLRELVDLSERPAAGETYSDRLLARMDNRVLLLAEALQKYGLVRVLDAAAAIDAGSRAATSAVSPDPAETTKSR